MLPASRSGAYPIDSGRPITSPADHVYVMEDKKKVVQGFIQAENAALVTKPYPSAIAEGVARLLEDPARCAAQGAAGSSLVLRRYSMDVIAPRWASLYGRASAGNSPVPDLDGAS